MNDPTIIDLHVRSLREALREVMDAGDRLMDAACLDFIRTGKGDKFQTCIDDETLTRRFDDLKWAYYGLLASRGMLDQARRIVADNRAKWGTVERPDGTHPVVADAVTDDEPEPLTEAVGDTLTQILRGAKGGDS